MQRLHARLDRLLGEHRRAVAAAFDERHARFHRIARQRIHGEHQRIFDDAVDHELVLSRIDVRRAVVDDGEVQMVRRDGAVEHVVRRARVLRCADSPFGLLRVRATLSSNFERGWIASVVVPCTRLHGSSANGSAAAPVARHAGRRAGESKAAPQQQAPVEQPIAGDGLQCRIVLAMWS